MQCSIRSYFVRFIIRIELFVPFSLTVLPAVDEALEFPGEENTPLVPEPTPLFLGLFPNQQFAVCTQYVYSVECRCVQESTYVHESGSWVYVYRCLNLLDPWLSVRLRLDCKYNAVRVSDDYS